MTIVTVEVDGSQAISRLEFNDLLRTIDVTYTDRTCYRYYNFTIRDWYALQDSYHKTDSYGKVINMVKRKHTFTRLD